MWWLSLVAHATPATDAALAALPAAPVDEWTVTAERAAGSGAIVRLRPRIDGVPVDAAATVVLGADGAVRRVRVDALPTERGPAARLDEVAAVAVAEGLGLGREPQARLSWQPIGSALRLVWTVQMRSSASPRFAAPQIRVDAATGAVLSVREGASHGVPAPLGRVFPSNPALDPVPAEVPLPWAGETLDDDAVLVRQCRDLGEVVAGEFDGVPYAYRVCTPVEAAPATGGNFLYDPVLDPVDPAVDEDDFAGPQATWNLHQGLEWFAGIGWIPLQYGDAPIETWVNYRVFDATDATTAGDPSAPLAPYRNAFMSPSYDEYEPSRIVFGQADPTDFAYDADVIHHELGHYVAYTSLALRFAPNTKYGPSIEDAALDEALADYFSAAIHGDPSLAEWAGGEDGRIRDLAGPETCADALYGEPHYDSLPVSTALWSVRATLSPEEQAAMDEAVYAGLVEVGFEASFAEAAAVWVDVVTDLVGPGAGAALAEAFTARGVDDCVPRVDVTPGSQPFRRFTYVPGSYEFSTSGPIPSYLQFRAEVPEGGARLTFTYAQAEYVGYDPFPSPVVPLTVVGRSGEAVRWDLLEETIEFTDFNLVLDAFGQRADTLGVPVEVGTHEDPEIPLYLLHDFELTWGVAEPGPFSFQFTNDQPYQVIVVGLALQMEPIAEDPPASEEDAGKCGCAHGSAVWTAGLPLLLGLVRRRR